MPTQHYIYSTLTSSQRYTEYRHSKSNDLPIVEKTILIHGGANVADKVMVTPRGVVTKVSDEELAILMGEGSAGIAFKNHIDNGFIKVETIKTDPEKVAANMTQRDDSSPLTPNDFVDDTIGSKPQSAQELIGKNEKLGKKLKAAMVGGDDD